MNEETIMKFDEDKNLRELQELLDREQQPSASARVRFLAKLQQQIDEQQTIVASPPPNRLITLFQSWWPAQPIGAFSYSAALLVVGLFTGQLLPPRSFGIGMDEKQLARQELNGARSIQLCSVPPPETNVL
jgi:hypothetical protein